MNCIIVDDDKMSRTAVRQFVERSGLLNLVGECADAEEALELMAKESVDLVFLDIQMPGMSGMELIRHTEQKPFYILITAKKEYAIEAFEHNVLDYLLKPISYARFLKAVERAVISTEKKRQAGGSRENIFVKVESGRLMKIHSGDILFIEALADYVVINVLINKSLEKITIHSTMKGIERKLPPHEFVRVHRSYIVRLDKISELEENTLTVHKNLIPIGRSFRSELINRLNFI